jgi:hypothetical protein
MFSNDDLPTFERPMKANSGSDSSGHESRFEALRSKIADEMSMMKNRTLIVAEKSRRGYNQIPFDGPGGIFPPIRSRRYIPLVPRTKPIASPVLIIVQADIVFCVAPAFKSPVSAFRPAFYGAATLLG